MPLKLDAGLLLISPRLLPSSLPLFLLLEKAMTSRLILDRQAAKPIRPLTRQMTLDHNFIKMGRIHMHHGYGSNNWGRLAAQA